MSPLGGITQRLPRVGWLEAAFLALLAVSLAMRLWELDGRAMHYDEAIHLHQSWQLANMVEYVHSPWMHGPLQIEMTAVVFWLLGDTDTTARLAYALFGVALVAVPYFLRRYLGDWGALFTAVMLAASPALLYFARFGRNDILMAFWSAALLTLFWRYVHEERDRYLYLAAGLLALMFATKETAYFVTLIFGGIAFLLALPHWAAVATRREKLAGAAGPAGFFLLLFTLTLPQWSALGGMFQDLLGLDLLSRGGESTGIVGAPHWGGPELLLPVAAFPPAIHGLVALMAAAGVVAWAWAAGFPGRGLAAAVLPPLGISAGAVALLTRPLGVWAVDGFICLALAATSAAVLVVEPRGWRSRLAAGMILSGLAAVYVVLFTPSVNLAGQVHALLPTGINVMMSSNGIPWNYVSALGIITALLLASLVLGLAWRAGVWLTCAAIFYSLWLVCYTTLFTNWAGILTGFWQSMGYWIAQQDVARGNQPWYYYMVELSVYETLPLTFGLAAALYFLRKADTFGLVLAVWAALTLAAYTVASEKMPWLVVNITLPFIFLAGKFLGELLTRVRWKTALRHGTALILIIVPAGIAVGVYLARDYLAEDIALSWPHWAILLGLALLAVVWACLVRAERAGRGLALTGLGLAGLLLGFTLYSSLRAAYTFDDSNLEILAYAQGSADLKTVYAMLREGAALSPDGRIPSPYQGEGRRIPSPYEGEGQGGGGMGNPRVLVDYDTWYPFQWYVRNETDSGALQHRCFKEENAMDWRSGCVAPSQAGDTGAAALLIAVRNGDGGPELEETYEKSGPWGDLLWFPESYRRPGENRGEESVWEELRQDADFFRQQAASRRAWESALEYALVRELRDDWYSADFHLYSRR